MMAIGTEACVRMLRQYVSETYGNLALMKKSSRSSDRRAAGVDLIGTQLSRTRW